MASDSYGTEQKGNKIAPTIPYLRKTDRMVIQHKHRLLGMEMEGNFFLGPHEESESSVILRTLANLSSCFVCLFLTVPFSDNKSMTIKHCLGKVISLRPPPP